MTRNAEREWRSADFIRIERAKHLIGAHFRGELKRRVVALGYDTEHMIAGSVPGFEIAGCDKATLKTFSTGRGGRFCLGEGTTPRFRLSSRDAASGALYPQVQGRTVARGTEPNLEGPIA